ncbi:MAG: aminotransferase class III-fold pyridoxal phosphate-dependent enzyme, partial [Aeromonas sp.]
YGGNPLACAVGLAALTALDQPALLANVQARSAQWLAGMQAINAQFDCFSDLRGQGLLLGAELKPALAGRAREVMGHALAAGVVVLAAGPDVLRFAPALNISAAEIEQGLQRLAQGLSAWLK